ncbi:glutaminyl-peptide cyclotransferase [Mesonia aquimarina]|uniref:glutaminyl-peptide cyclotransferase n=1 Tax=Mesonia aquimarina TaxID=1504967 RepID=UPI000EF5887E|nr:glutaminyl-peptide cyclotransferase [Mesonia aquimarina]
MRFYNLLMLFILSLTVLACNDENASENSSFSLKITSKQENIQAKKAFEVQITNTENQTIDSVAYFYANQKITTSKNNKAKKIQLEKPLGRNQFSATIYTDGEEETLQKEVILHAENAPKVYTYEIVNTYPHDPAAFTQGLEFYKDTLYEGTGTRGESSIRKVDFKTGEVLEKTNLDYQYFGEGITILNQKLYQLTWQNNKGFVYDVNTLEKLTSFAYNESKEGWGLCNDGEKLYKSDGTEKIWILDAETLEEKSFIQPVTHKSLPTKLNELEWVEGKIYANTWQKDGIAIINPKTGAIDGLIDFRGLRDNLGNKEKLNPGNDVLNGVAYNSTTKKLYVTGKHWDKLFEVKIIEK